MNMSETEVWSSGGGLNSCAIAALIIQGKLPKPDVSVIVDTGRERFSTWNYMDSVVSPALKDVGVNLVRVKKDKFATVDLWSGKDKNTIIMPGFTDQSGSPGKLSNFCSNEWKTRVIGRYLRSIGVKKSKRWIGFTVDEPRRWIKMDNKPDIRLPLVRDYPLNREGCRKVITDMGWPEAPRSNCWMCPNMLEDEWMTLSKEEFSMAVKLEREIREKDEFFYLHPSCVPLDQVDFDRQPTLFERSCNSGECFV